MRILLVLALAATLAGQEAPLPTIAGKVVNSVTGEPVSRAQVVLRSTVSGSVVTTTSDRDGKFSAKDLPPGDYSMFAGRPGFVEARSGNRAITIARGQKFENLEIAMTPHAVIAGRVLNSDGDPVQSANVRVLRMAFDNGAKRLVETSTSGITNDIGEYRLPGLVAGDYYVAAFTPVSSRYEDHSPKGASLPTYYPGTVESSGAVAIRVNSSGVASGIDIALQMGPRYRISGRIVNKAGADQQRIRAALSVVGIGAGEDRMIVPDKDGNFTISGISQGDYEIVAGVAGGGMGSVARKEFRVINSDIQNIVLEMQPVINVNGEIRAETNGAFDPSVIAVGAQPVASRSHWGVFTPAGTITLSAYKYPAAGKDGKFQIANLVPGRYRVRVGDLPPDFYIKSIQSGNQDLLGTEWNLIPGAPETLRVVISNKAGEVEGKTDATTVVFIPEDQRMRATGTFHRVAQANLDGKYKIQGLAPGTYKVYAFKDIEDRAWLDPDLIEPLKEKAPQVVITESSKTPLDLTAITIR
jgi:hypothetical protein